MDSLIKFIYIVASSGSSYLTYVLKSILFVKGALLKFLSYFSFVESFLARLFGDYKGLASTDLLPNSYVSNTFFYKTRNSSSYLAYLSNILSYFSILSLFNDIDYKGFYKNKGLFYAYFSILSQSHFNGNSARSVVNTLDLNSLEELYSHNNVPNFNELNSHFSVFFMSFLKSKFSHSNSLVGFSNKLSHVAPGSLKSIYSFINAQSYTVHNTKLEII